MDLKYKKHFTTSNLITLILVLFIAAMLFFPGVKAGVIRGLMTIGLFQPKAPSIDGTETAVLQAPSLLLSDENGQPYDLANQKGKVLFINFWATWCPPCIAEMPSINKLHAHFKQNEEIDFILIDVDARPEKSLGFMARHKWPLPVYFPGQNIHPDYFRGTLPTTVIVNKEGAIVFKHTGAGDFSNQSFKAYLEALTTE